MFIRIQTVNVTPPADETGPLTFTTDIDPFAVPISRIVEV